jgi:magnesium-protoporphyrin IX monomethyl ester (oxidative) cyclase
LLDIDHPKFKLGLDRLAALSLAMSEAQARGGLFNKLKRGYLALSAGFEFVKLYFIPVIPSRLPEQVRLVPTW